MIFINQCIIFIFNSLEKAKKEMEEQNVKKKKEYDDKPKIAFEKIKKPVIKKEKY